MNFESLRAATSALLVFVGVGVLGCSQAEQGDGLAREAVAGTVTLDGQPLNSASIQFIPAAPGTSPEASGEIKDGKFEIGRDRGPVAGEYKVMISTSQSVEVQPGEMPGDPPKPKADPVPAKYNTATTLTAEVKAGGPNEFEFALEAK